MPKMSATEAAQKWQNRTTAAVGDYTAGVQRVTESPTHKAAQEAAKMLQNVMEAIQSGKWARALEKVSLEEWKKATAEKGSARMAAGVQGAVGKQEQYYTEAFPVLERIQREIAAMPSLTVEDSIARAAHFIREMNKFGKSR